MLARPGCTGSRKATTDAARGAWPEPWVGLPAEHGRDTCLRVSARDVPTWWGCPCMAAGWMDECAFMPVYAHWLGLALVALVMAVVWGAAGARGVRGWPDHGWLAWRGRPPGLTTGRLGQTGTNTTTDREDTRGTIPRNGALHFDPSWYPSWPTWGAYELTPSQYEKRKERERRRPSRMNRRRRLGRRAPNRRALTQAALRLMPIQARKRRVRAWWRGQKRREMDPHLAFYGVPAYREGRERAGARPNEGKGEAQPRAPPGEQEPAGGDGDGKREGRGRPQSWERRRRRRVDARGLLQRLDEERARRGEELLTDPDLEHLGVPADYVWQMSIQEWNALMRALHGNGRGAGRGGARGGGRGAAKARGGRSEQKERRACCLTLNVCGLHLERRGETMEEIEELRGGTGGASRVRDTGNDTTEKLEDVIGIIKQGCVTIATLADTKQTRRELEEAIALLQTRGLDGCGTPGWCDHISGEMHTGVLIVWDPTHIRVENRDTEGRAVATEVEEGRIVSVEVEEVASCRKWTQFGVYMPVRQRTATVVRPTWEKLTEALDATRGEYMIGGDFQRRDGGGAEGKGRTEGDPGGQAVPADAGGWRPRAADHGGRSHLPSRDAD